MKQLQEKLRIELDRKPQLLPTPGQSAGIACSGGLDSMMLARLLTPILLERGNSPFLAWLDHGWRPTDAPREFAFVRALAQEIGASFVWARRPPDGGRVRAVGREAAAREQRRRWLSEVAEKAQATRVYLGHHQDDQIETVMLRRAEGVPAYRAATMSEISGVFTRPLLGITKDELELAAHSQGWQWLEDCSNQDLSLARNRIRKELRQKQSIEGRAVIERILAEGNRARTYLDALQREVDATLGQVLREGEEGDSVLQLSGTALRDLSEDVAMLTLQRLCFAEPACGRVPQRRALAPLLQEPGSGRTKVFHLGAEWTARMTGDQIELARGEQFDLEAAAGGLQASLCLGQEVEWPSFGRLQYKELALEEAQRMLVSEPGAGIRFAVFDPDGLVGPLHVRGAGIGLHISPFGFRGTRKVRDLLAEAGVPRYQRANWPVVVDAQSRVLWLPGIRAGSHAPLRGSSTTAVLLYTTASLHLGRSSTSLRNLVS